MSRPSTAKSTRYHLAEIIDLFPDEEPWCAGFAPSQGRRCRRRIHASDRSTALLDLASEELETGGYIDEFLDDLAPLVLCTANHQSQTDSLAASWKSQVQTFQTAQATQDQTAERDRVRERMTAVSKEVHVDTSSLRSLRRPDSSTAGMAAPTPRSAATTTTSSSSSATPRRRVRQNASTPAHHSTLIHASPTVGVETESSRRPRIAVASTPDRSGLADHARNFVARRCVEGECAICVLSLFDPGPCVENSKMSDKEKNRGKIQHKEDIPSTASSNRTFRECDKLKDLVWCKRRCGSNFHKSCIDQWIAACRLASRSTTCPTCRSLWG
ncbi:hypothetical protein BDV28DRAFT_73605 [Aspergillus coremiiformis]|uniref:RING-type domain-containing protein n=1 Tax=Aspergillus coremiiformis TaxID=138285 RepID=A0A5N6ZD02_9EURO|nr:hypothetical protein BDV28DRAFT_73605 [Aspergillus coremiiformis]